MPGKGKKGGGLETKSGFTMKGTALYDKVKTRGGHTMMMKSVYKDKHSMMKDHTPTHDDKLMDPEQRPGSAAFQHPMDAWGFPHGDENHRTPAEDVAAGQPVGGPKGTPKKHMHGSAMNHPKDSQGFAHDSKYHMAPADDVATRGSSATQFYEEHSATTSKPKSKK